MFVNFNILNQLGSPAINSNTFANRPAAGQTGRLFVSTDTFEIYRDNGTTWDLIGGPGTSTITGTGTATQVAYFTSSQAIGSSANLFWDNTNGFLGVGTAVPSARVEAVKTDGYGIYANYTTNAGSGASAAAIYAINTTAGSGYAAVIEEKTGNTTGGQYPLLVKHSLSSGTAAVGNGTGLQFQLQDDAGTFKTTQLTIETTDAAAATYKSRYRFNVQNNGSSTPVAYLNATGLGLFTATPGAALDIHSTGVMAQLNSTSATANSLLAFQRSGSGLWRIGDNYNSGSNFFELYNTVLSTNAISVLAATNKTEFTAVENYTSGLARGNYFDYNLNVPAGTSFTSPNAITALGASLDLSLAGSATIPSGARTGLDVYNSVAFTGAGTLTMTQGSNTRAYSNLTTGWAFNGSAIGTITHLAGLRVLFPDNSGSTLNVTNNFALLINNQDAATGTITYSNRWGIYQEGASDLNYLNANLLLGSTTNTGDKLQVNGSTRITGSTQIDNNLNIVNGSVNFGGTGTFLSTDPSIYRIAGNNLIFAIGSAERLRLDANGNLGLGVTPSAWNSSIYKVLQLGPQSAIGSLSNTYTVLGTNWYDDGANKYIQNGYATLYYQNAGQHIWNTAPSGTAGNTITFTTAMTLTTGSELFVGGTNTSIYSTPNRCIIGMNGGVAGALFVFQTGSGDRGYVYHSGTNMSLWNRENGIIDFGTNNLERGRITAGGNWLIGTSTDTGQKLQVNGYTYITTSDNNVYILDLYQSASNTYGAIAIRGTNRGGEIDFFDATTVQSAIYSEGGATKNLILSTNGYTEALRLTNTQNAEFAGSIKTAAPAGGTSRAWKLGARVAATVALDTTQYIEVEIAGNFYKLAIVT